MIVKIKSTSAYIGLEHLIGQTFHAVKLNCEYSGYYVDVEVVKGKTTSLYFLPHEVEEVMDVSKVGIPAEVYIIIIWLALIIICNLIIN